MTTDTPRTDEIFYSMLCEADLVDFAKQLERELAASKAEVAALRAEKNACLEGNKYYADKAVILQDKINRAIDVLMEKIQ